MTDRLYRIRKNVLLNLFGIYFGFMGMTVICMAVRPSMFDHPDWGISYFGSPGNSDIPYFAGFAIMIGCMIAIVHELSGFTSRLRIMRRILTASVLCVTGIALTSYPQGPVPYWAHIYICYVLLAVQIFMLVWILRQKLASAIDYLCLLGLVVALALLTLSNSATHVLGLYVLGEVIGFIATLVLMGRATLRLLSME